MSTNVLCRMCLADSEDLMKIFSETNHQSKIAAIIAQHFWFEPEIDDPVSNMLCIKCWQQIEGFHSYYQTVEEAQRKLSERLPVKQETLTSSHLLNFETQIFLKADHETDILHDIGAMDTLEDFLKQPEGNSSHDGSQGQFEKHLLSKTTDNEGIKLEEQIGTSSSSSDESEDYQFQSQNEDFDSNADNEISTPKKKRTSTGKQKPAKQKTKLTQKEWEEMKQKRAEVLENLKRDDEKIRSFMQLKCDLCGQTDLQCFADVVRHFRDQHQQRGYILCCKKKIFKRQLLIDHVNLHSNPDAFKCEICNKRYVHNEGLKKHMFLHETDKSKAFKCDQCPKIFSQACYLRYHTVTHMPVEEQQIYCEDCGKRFASHALLKLHRRCHKEKSDGQLCHICARFFRDKKVFAKHQLKHAGVNVPKVQCKECGAWLYEECMRKHLQLHDTTEQVCRICGKICPTKVSMERHVRYNHTIQPTFACNVCGKSFKTAIGLREHMATHTGEPVYTCQHCPKTFKSHANMHSHRKKMHYEEWAEARRIRIARQQGSSQSNKQICISNGICNDMDENSLRNLNRSDMNV